jgi:hypothetical protein
VRAQVQELEEDLEFSNQMFHDLSVFSNGLKLEINEAKDLLVRIPPASTTHMPPIYTLITTCPLHSCISRAVGMRHASSLFATLMTAESTAKSWSLRFLVLTLCASRVDEQVKIGTEQFSDVIPVHVFCEATDTEVCGGLVLCVCLSVRLAVHHLDLMVRPFNIRSPSYVPPTYYQPTYLPTHSP